MDLRVYSHYLTVFNIFLKHWEKEYTHRLMDLVNVNLHLFGQLIFNSLGQHYTVANVNSIPDSFPHCFKCVK